MNAEWSAVDFINKTITRENGFTLTLIDAVEEVVLQAERAQELEKERDTYKQLHKTYLDKFTSAVGERNRLREALEFYADMKKYDEIFIPGVEEYQSEPILDDNGEKARKALEVSE